MIEENRKKQQDFQKKRIKRISVPYLSTQSDTKKLERKEIQWQGTMPKQMMVRLSSQALPFSLTVCSKSCGIARAQYVMRSCVLFGVSCRRFARACMETMGQGAIHSFKCIAKAAGGTANQGCIRATVGSTVRVLPSSQGLLRM